MKYKICCECKDEKHPTRFNKNISALDGRQARCRQCEAIIRNKNGIAVRPVAKNQFDDYRKKREAMPHAVLCRQILINAGYRL